MKYAFHIKIIACLLFLIVLAFHETPIFCSTESTIISDYRGGCQISNFIINDTTFFPGEIIKGSFDFLLWNTEEHANSFHQIVIGIDDIGIECVASINEVVYPQLYPGHVSFAFEAPITRGKHELRIANIYHYSPEAAIADFPGDIDEAVLNISQINIVNRSNWERIKNWEWTGVAGLFTGLILGTLGYILGFFRWVESREKLKIYTNKHNKNKK